MILLSASAPGTSGMPAPSPSYPGVYRTAFDPATHVVALSPLFADEASAVVANTTHRSGQERKSRANRFRLQRKRSRVRGSVPGGPHADQPGRRGADLCRRRRGRSPGPAALKLSNAVDDTAWPSGAFGAIYATDSSNDTINRITGPFRRASVFVAATPCGASDAPGTCPGPGFPGNYLGELNPRTGVITRVHSAVRPQRSAEWCSRDPPGKSPRGAEESAELSSARRRCPKRQLEGSCGVLWSRACVAAQPGRPAFS